MGRPALTGFIWKGIGVGMSPAPLPLEPIGSKDGKTFARTGGTNDPKGADGKVADATGVEKGMETDGALNGATPHASVPTAECCDTD